MGERIYTKIPPEERFWSKVHKTETCWLWTAGCNGNGYGAFMLEWSQAPRPAHMVSYEWLIGPVPPGLELDHLCRIPTCVRPDHLEPVTHAENMRRADLALGIRSAATVCKRGHPLFGENVRAYRGRRICRACMRWHQAQVRARSRSVRQVSEGSC